LAALQNAFRSIGYETQVCRTEAASFGLPQRRVRLIMFMVDRLSRLLIPSALNASLEGIVELMRAFRCRAPDLRDVLLPDTDEAVEAELVRRSAVRAAAKGARATLVWPALHLATLRRAGLELADITLPPAAAALPWAHVLTARQKQCLGFSLRTRGAGVMPDVSQMIHRMPRAGANAGGRTLAPTMLPATELWTGSRFLLGREALTIQGFPVAKLPPAFLATVSEAAMQDLAGNAFPATVVVAAVVASLTSLPWRSQAQDIETEVALRAAQVSLGLHDGGGRQVPLGLRD
jgi:site-specific DNA-cytosine methylase